MLARLWGQDRDDEGFTLIELLVVIIIIGILAAIAIPVFLNQRKKGYDASVKADLRNAATSEETYLTDYFVYTTSVGSLSNEGFKMSSNNTLHIGIDASKQYCIAGSNSGSGAWFLYDSGSGGEKITTYTTAAAAEAGCTDTAITSYS